MAAENAFTSSPRVSDGAATEEADELGDIAALRVPRGEVTEAGLYGLCRSLQTNRTLRTLAFEDEADVGVEGGRALAAALATGRNTTLKKVVSRRVAVL